MSMQLCEVGVGRVRDAWLIIAQTACGNEIYDDETQPQLKGECGSKWVAYVIEELSESILMRLEIEP